MNFCYREGNFQVITRLLLIIRSLSNPFWLQKEYHQAVISKNKFKAPLFIPGECEVQAHTTKELEECKAEIMPKGKII